MNNPKISIIVPVYNVEKYLRRCLDSIVAQTFTDWECICVDDGSPDNSGKILDEYAVKDKRFVIIHKENGGVSSARNTGLNIARGEWISFCDSDDWIDKKCFEKVFVFCKSDVDIVTYGFYICDDYGYKKAYKPIVFFQNQEAEYALWNKFIRKSLIDNFNIRFDENTRLGEDVLFSLECLICSRKSKNIKQCLYFYFQKPDSVMHSITLSYLNDLEASVAKLNDFLNKKNINIKKKNFLLTSYKVRVKDMFLIYNEIPDLKKWRLLFPECNNLKILFPIKKVSLIYLLILCHIDFLIYILFWIKRKR